MKDTGIARRVDQLGRIVLPMEIRKKLKIVEGTLLNMVCEDGVITLEKYSPLLNFKEYVEDIMAICNELTYMVCDDASVILASKHFKLLTGKAIDTGIFKGLKKNEIIKDAFDGVNEIACPLNYFYIQEISKDGDLFGYLVFAFETAPSEVQIGECKFVCKYISSKL